MTKVDNMENQEPFESRIDLTEIQTAYDSLKTEINKVIVGQDKLVEHLIIALFCEGHVLLEGMPGVAKTLAAKCLARTVASEFTRIQFTPDLMPSDIIGTVLFNVQSSTFDFKKGPIFSNVVLIDEINRSPAKTQAALFECMEEQQITVDGTGYKLESPFFVIGTQNPVDHEGTYRLPEAQLDRFLFKLNVDYPNVEIETQIIARHHENTNLLDLKDIKPVIDKTQLKRIQGVIDSIVVKPDLFRYIAQISHETRNNPSLFLGASPRASINMLMAAKTVAAVQGRDFVTPDDIKEVVVPVLNHRISLRPEKEMEGQTVAEVLQRIIQKIEVPR